MFLIFESLVISVFTTGKIAMALTLLRIIGTIKDWRKWVLYFLMISVSLLNSLSCVFLFVECEPPKALWESTPSAKCWTPKTYRFYYIIIFSKLT